MIDPKIKELEDRISALSLDLYIQETKVDEVLEDVVKTIELLSDRISDLRAAFKETGKKL